MAKKKKAGRLSSISKKIQRVRKMVGETIEQEEKIKQTRKKISQIISDLEVEIDSFAE